MTKKKSSRKKVVKEVTSDFSFEDAQSLMQKDINKAKQYEKKIEPQQKVDFFVTYGWAIAVIIIGLLVFMWWNFFSIHKESCEFVDGSGILCQEYGVTNESIDLGIRNLNNKTIQVTYVGVKDCEVNPNIEIPKNDRRTIKIPCEISSGRLRSSIKVTYTMDEISNDVKGKIEKIVPK